jgi:hypothetical protein
MLSLALICLSPAVVPACADDIALTAPDATLDRAALMDVRDRILELVVGSVDASPDELDALAAVSGPLLELWLQGRALPGGELIEMTGCDPVACAYAPSVEDLWNLRAALRGTVRELVGDLQTTGRFAAIVSGPADALLADTQARRTGVVAGQVVNDIPGAEAWATGEAEMYLAPAVGRYELTIAGTASGWADLTVLRADRSGRLEVRSFEDLPVTAGARVSVPILPSGDAQAALTATGLSLPTVSGVLDPEAAFWVTPAALEHPAITGPPGMQPAPLAADSFVKRAVICLDIDEQGKLVGESNAFGFGVEKVGLYVRMVDAPPGSEVTLEWLHEGNPLHKQIIMVEGTHSSFTYLAAVNKPQLWEGAHAVIIRENGRHVGTVTFTVR